LTKRRATVVRLDTYVNELKVSPGIRKRIVTFGNLARLLAITKKIKFNYFVRKTTINTFCAPFDIQYTTQGPKNYKDVLINFHFISHRVKIPRDRYSAWINH